MTLAEVKAKMLQDPLHWFVPFMDFVDEFRREKGRNDISEPIVQDNERFDALLASTIEYLCNEGKTEPPQWVYTIPGCRDPWFVSGMENLKAIAIVESPIWFRTRKIFVLENFLSRV
jgi:hypothetical protein